MGRQVGILSARAVATASRPGLHPDGGNLYLVVKAGPEGQLWKSWVFRYKRNGKARDMGLGPTHTVNLTRAREEATRYRLMLRDGFDPIDQRKADRQARAGIPTFWEAATAYIEGHKAEWKNGKHAAQWESTLETYAKPVIGDKPISDVTTDDVLEILKPIWTTKAETASRLRQRLFKVIAAAKTKGQFKGDNPAQWSGHLDNLLPRSSRVHTVKHFPALPFKEIQGFMRLLRGETGTAARALEFLILTASRTGMVTKANRSEFRGNTWTVPAARMKTKKLHVVPLAKQAVALYEALPEDGEPVFAGARNAYLSNGAMDALLERMGYSHITVHGFRSTFKDWASETTTYPNELSEAALAHAIKDKTEAAYRRGDLLQKRRKMMQAWADYCLPAKKGRAKNAKLSARG